MEGKIEEERKKEDSGGYVYRFRRLCLQIQEAMLGKEEELSGPCNSAPHLFHVLGGGIYKVIINRGYLYIGLVYVMLGSHMLV